MEYQKELLTISEQINLLRSRGLLIEDDNKLEKILKNISYFHLSIYFKAFQKQNNQFIEEVYFNDILNIYNFDKKLRLLLINVLERIELSLKSVLIYEISKKEKDNYWYSKKSLFNNNSGIEKILNTLKESKEIYIQHYYKKYSKPEFPPTWMFFENLSFGECTRMLMNLAENNRNIVDGFYKMPKTVIQIFHHLSILRNFCAHNSRIWNRKFPFQVPIYKSYENIFKKIKRDSLFAYIILIQLILQKIHPESKWLNSLNSLIDDHNIKIDKMGFPDNWKNILSQI